MISFLKMNIKIHGRGILRLAYLFEMISPLRGSTEMATLLDVNATDEYPPGSSSANNPKYHQVD